MEAAGKPTPPVSHRRPRSRRPAAGWAGLATLAAALLIEAAATPNAVAAAAAGPVPSPPPVTGNASGQPWLSGVNGDPQMTPAAVDQFCLLRGDPCDVAQVYVSRRTWASIVEPSYAETNFAGWPGKLAIAVPPFPEDGTSNLQACAAGTYNGHWQEFGRTLNATGRQSSIIRLAWEGNGRWYPWSGSDPAAYISCFRQVVNSIRSTVSAPPRFDWSINAHISQNPPSHVPTDLYPGDQWVDVVSIDAFDHYPASRTLAQFNDQAEAMGGITWLYDFARAHGRLFGIPEWGVASGSGAEGGGDNASYIRFMRDWMTARAGRGLYYEAYFNTCDNPSVGSNLDRPLGAGCAYANPAAATLYTQLWRARP